MFERHDSLAAIFEPGDGTRYEMVAVKTFDGVNVVVMNDSFFDMIMFLNDNEEPYATKRPTIDGCQTNFCTIKAAKKIRDLLISQINHPISKPINLLFENIDHEGNFVDAVTDDGQDVKVGEWSQREDGYWNLRITELPQNYVCPKCGQHDHGQYGEYPCPVCGLPMTWDK